MKHLLIFKYVEAIASAGSIRKASELLAITPSALNRQLLSLEEELGVQIFERLTTGVRLNTAGEIMLGHIRSQVSDMERVKSKIADLSGVRVGHVKIAASPEAMGLFLSNQIKLYKNEHKGVSFSVDQHFRGDAENSLNEFASDIAMVFEPIKLADFQTVLSVKQQVLCVMNKSHPLAKKKTIRLYECAEYPANLPSMNWGLRVMLERAALKLGIRLKSTFESNSQKLLDLQFEDKDSLSFFIPANLPNDIDQLGLCCVPVNQSDVAPGFLFIGHLKGRALPVAAARFLDQLSSQIGTTFN